MKIVYGEKQAESIESTTALRAHCAH